MAKSSAFPRTAGLVASARERNRSHVTSSLSEAMAASKSRRLKASITSRTAWTFSFDIPLQYRVTAVSDTAPLLLCAKKAAAGRRQSARVRRGPRMGGARLERATSCLKARAAAAVYCDLSHGLVLVAPGGEAS